MNIKISLYGHAILISMLGLWIAIMFNGVAGGLMSGFLIGVGLRLARKSGEKE